MAYEIAILNPRRKKAKRAGKSRRKSSRSKTSMARRNSKGQFVKGHRAKKRRSTRVSNPRRKKRVAAKKVSAKRVRRKASGKRTPAMGYVTGTKPIRRRKLNPRRKHHAKRRHKRHSNPRFSVAGITSQIMPAAYGAAGGIALDVVLGYLPIPAMLTAGYAKHATRVVGALGVGYVARKFLGAKGSAVAAGALTIAMYGLLKDVLVQFAPGVKGVGDYEEIAIDNTADQIGAYMDPAARLGAYLPDGSRAPGMGAYMAGPTDDSWDRDGAVLSGMDY